MKRLPKAALDMLRAGTTHVGPAQTIFAFEYDDGAIEAYGHDAVFMLRSGVSPDEQGMREIEPGLFLFAVTYHTNQAGHDAAKAVSDHEGLPVLVLRASDVIAEWEACKE